MADIFLSFFLDNLTQLLSQEVNLLLDVEAEVNSLIDQLKLILCFLRDNEGKRNEQGIVSEWMSQLEEAAHEAEDAIDNYYVHVAHERGQHFATKLITIFGKVIARHEVGKKIEDVNTRINGILGNKDKFSIQIPETGDQVAMVERPRRLPIEEADVVGFDDKAAAIIKQLTGGEPSLDVVPIVGMGGIGKTTLARKVYNDPIVKDHFDCRVWVYVTQEYRERELLHAIIKCAMVLTDEMKEMDNDELRSNLYKYLRGTRYLIVLDDVWKTKFWDDLNEIFPNNRHGSRIIITTRINEVALYTKPSNPPHNMHFLSKEESWELFSKKVFGAGRFPQELKELGQKIAGQCGGLPLAIVVLAGVLSKKEKTKHIWLRVSNSVSSHLNRETEQCRDILALSYKNLPRHLKSCFLYFGVFPEDFEIPAKQLIRLWLAEGIVQQKDRQTVEDTADDYLEELIDRNLIQVAKKTSDGGVKACRIHDLLRDLCISIAEQEKFLKVLGYANSSCQSKSRRLGIHSNNLNCISSYPAAANLRSFLCFRLDEGRLSLNHWKLIYKRFTLLKVLDLWAVIVDTIPTDIEKLIHLRYLRLKSHTPQSLPLSICNLWNLETLEVVAPFIGRPKIGIWKMPQLRHLQFHGQAVVLQEPPPRMRKERDGCLCNLHTLTSISPDSCTEGVLSKLPNLITLEINGDLEKHMDQAFPNIARLNCLKSLKLVRDRRCDYMKSIPDCVVFPSNLTKLTLSETQLSEDPMGKLGQLPNLEVLRLTNSACVDRDLYCSHGFPRLQVLKLKNLSIRTWEVSRGAMPSLRSVVIKRCGNLKNLPSALQHMTSLQELELWGPSVSVANQATDIQKNQGNNQIKLLIYQPDAR
ncbi:hypothetical protein HHK36_017804 [Tetracentron sinense]|uniref:Uncharacterized protein n=1 Tax=Tetracentron sinense TaxID=13715 RepID=A0A834Z0B9_TETSI|nr:hypothetical protein HHK36_017804 [Tetracentron sinense]